MKNSIMNSEKGAITLYVVLACLFFVFTVTGVYITNVNRLKSQEKDIKQIQENYARQLNNIDEEYEEVRKKYLNVGDYIDYIPDQISEGYSADKLGPTYTGSSSNTEEIIQDKQYARDKTGMTWQILRIYEDGSMDLIGSATSQRIYFQGADGYNNGVTIMNDICETLYSKGDIKARSVKYEDLEYWLTDEGKKLRDTYTWYNEGPLYGHTQTYTSPSYRYYPNLYAQEKGSKIDSDLNGLTDGIDKENGNAKGLNISEEGTASGYTQANSSLTVTQTFWYVEISSTTFKEGYDALKSDEPYWIASRYITCLGRYADFGIRYMDKNALNGKVMFNSGTGFPRDSISSFRPVVTLGPDAKIKISTTADSKDTPHTIIEY